MLHIPTIAVRKPQNSVQDHDSYYGNMPFECPACNRTGVYFLKLLGCRFIECNGERFIKIKSSRAYRGIIE